jgi:hypothetical protein
MPRDGSDVYHIPPGTEGVPDTTIESNKYNAFVHDVEQDLNTPRPIVAGGTGATNADDALENMGAEKASQQVTNYDSHVWMPGSFWSATSATNAPVASHAFAGTVFTNGTDIVVEARDLTDAAHMTYVRAKTGGTWGAWIIDVDPAKYVDVAGDTMTGDLTIQKAGPAVLLDKTAAGQGAYMLGQLAGKNRWHVAFGDAVTEPGGNVGSNFGIARYDDAGGIIDVPFVIERATGKASVGQDPSTQYGIANKGYVDNGLATKIGDAPDANIFMRQGGIGWQQSWWGQLDAPVAAGFDLNGLTIAGIYRVQNPVNGPGVPGETFYHVRVLAGNTNFVIQEAWTYTQTPVEYYYRCMVNTTWGPWLRVSDPYAMCSIAELWANSYAANKQLVSGSVLWGAQNIVILAPSGTTYTPNFSLGINFMVNGAVAGGVMAAVQNVKEGQSGVISFYQNASGNGTVVWVSGANGYYFPGGIKPQLTQVANAVDLLSYYYSQGRVNCTWMADVK